MAGWRPLVALAFVAYIAVAAELWFANVHLILAALIVLGLRRWPWAFAIGAAIKIAPGLGILYLVVRRRWRDASRSPRRSGLVILVVSVLIGPSAWSNSSRSSRAAARLISPASCRSPTSCVSPSAWS